MDKTGKQELLRVEHLKKYFKTSSGMLHAVDDVSFTIYEGDTLGVVGESGCGKSTNRRSGGRSCGFRSRRRAKSITRAVTSWPAPGRS